MITIPVLSAIGALYGIAKIIIAILESSPKDIREGKAPYVRLESNIPQ